MRKLEECQTTTIRLLLPNTQLSQRTEAGVEFEVLSCAWRGVAAIKSLDSRRSSPVDVAVGGEAICCITASATMRLAGYLRGIPYMTFLPRSPHSKLII